MEKLLVIAALALAVAIGFALPGPHRSPNAQAASQFATIDTR